MVSRQFASGILIEPYFEDSEISHVKHCDELLAEFLKCDIDKFVIPVLFEKIP